MHCFIFILRKARSRGIIAKDHGHISVGCVFLIDTWVIVGESDGIPIAWTPGGGAARDDACGADKEEAATAAAVAGGGGGGADAEGGGEGPPLVGLWLSIVFNSSFESTIKQMACHTIESINNLTLSDNIEIDWKRV